MNKKEINSKMNNIIVKWNKTKDDNLFKEYLNLLFKLNKKIDEEIIIC